LTYSHIIPQKKILLTNFNWLIILISILYISTNAELNILPQSIIELKQYYDVINNLEKRGILNKDIAILFFIVIL
jgi:hypothetical protein